MNQECFFFFFFILTKHVCVVIRIREKRMNDIKAKEGMRATTMSLSG